MAGGIQNNSEEDQLNSEINMIPLIDVMLVLLIIFMVAAPMMNDMVDVNLPKAQAKSSEAEDKSVILSVRENQSVFIGKTEVKLEELNAKLSSIFANRNRKEIFINADEKVPHGFIIKVMADVQKAGVFKISFLTDPAP